MRAHKLLLDIKAFLEAALADMPLPDSSTGKDALGKAQCFFGNVPDSNEEVLPNRFPFVVIRWTEGEDQENADSNSGVDTVALILGVYAPDGPGEAELVTAILMDHLRSALMRNRILASMFDLQLPLSSAKPDPEKRQHNYHIATILTRWNFSEPRRPLPPEGEIHE